MLAEFVTGAKATSSAAIAGQKVAVFAIMFFVFFYGKQNIARTSEACIAVIFVSHERAIQRLPG